MTQTSEGLSQAMEKATAARGDWEVCGVAWMRVAEIARELGNRPVLEEALLRGVDATRRADWPERVEACARLALALVKTSDSRILLLVHLAASLLEAGDVERARREAESALQLAGGGPMSPYAADTLAGIRLVSGQVDGLGELLEQWPSQEGTGGAAQLYRRGQLLRLGGDLDEARQCFLRTIGELENREGAEAALGAAWQEMGEVELLVDAPDQAANMFHQSVGWWQKSGRKSGFYRAEAGRARSMLATQQTYLPQGLDAGIHYARERTMPLLEAEIRLARGICRWEASQEGALEDLNTAVRIGEERGSPLVAGRARLERFLRGEGSGQRDLEVALRELQGDSWWRQRAWSTLRASRS